MAKTALAAGEELVVLVDEGGKEIGTAAKASVQHEATPSHRAFSCYLFDGDGRVLLTRRALQKRTWPGVWTNSFCGHPSPGERTVDAVRRRGRQELGLTIDEAVCVLPDFRYRAVAADGAVENKICPVFCAHSDDSVRPAPDEVMDYRWVPWREVRQDAGLPWVISPWAVEQIPLLDASTYMVAPVHQGVAPRRFTDVAGRGLLARDCRVRVCCARHRDSTVTAECEQSFGVLEVVAP